LDPIDISETAYNAFVYAPEEGTPAATFTPARRLELHDQLEFAKETGQAVNPLGHIVPWTAGQKAMGITQNLDTVLSDVATQLGVGIPMFPAEFGSIFDRMDPAKLAESYAETSKTRAKEQANLDLGRAQERMRELQKEGAINPITGSPISVEMDNLLFKDGAPIETEYSPYEERLAYDEETRQWQAVGDPFLQTLMEQSRRERLREVEEQEYVQEQARLRRMPQLASATQFAKAIREAAPEDIGFQQFLIGESAEIRGGFKGTAGTPLDFSEYFVGITPGLRQRFGETPQGVASELMRFEREEREGERLELEAEREDIKAEQERRRSLRGRGRTELRI